MPKNLIVCLDPGHGMSNKRDKKYDSGAIGGGIEEATVAMNYVNEIRSILYSRGWGKKEVIRTRVDEKDPAPVSRRDDIAELYNCDIMISIHCNSFNGVASGTEVIFRGEDDRAFAAKLSKDISGVYGIPNRGAKTEKDSQHPSLAVMEFDKCWLIELGFIDNPVDRGRITSAVYQTKVCNIIADNIQNYQSSK